MNKIKYLLIVTILSISSYSFISILTGLTLKQLMYGCLPLLFLLMVLWRRKLE